MLSLLFEKSKSEYDTSITSPFEPVAAFAFALFVLLLCFCGLGRDTLFVCCFARARVVICCKSHLPIASI